VSKKSKTKTKTTPWDPAAIKRGTAALDAGYGQTQATIAQYSPALNNAIQHISDNIAHPMPYVRTRRTNSIRRSTAIISTLRPTPIRRAWRSSSPTGRRAITTRRSEPRDALTAAGRASLSQGVGDALNNFYGNIYNTERGRQSGRRWRLRPSTRTNIPTSTSCSRRSRTRRCMPLGAAATYAGGLGGLLSPYNTQTTTQKKIDDPAATSGWRLRSAGAFGTGGAPHSDGGAMSMDEEHGWSNGMFGG
jgi:hypothetical protein